MSWNRRDKRIELGDRHVGLRPALVGRQVAAEVLDGDTDRGERRLEIVAQRRQQRGGQIGLLPDQFRGVALDQELRALDGDGDDAGERVQGAEVQGGGDRGEQADRLDAMAKRHDGDASVLVAEAHVAAVGALVGVELERPARLGQRGVQRIGIDGDVAAAPLVDAPAVVRGQADRDLRPDSNRRATCRASASIARPVSVVSSTSRVRSKSRVTSLRRAIASRSRARAAADRLLAMMATMRNAISAIQFCGSAIVSAPTGGRK